MKIAIASYAFHGLLAAGKMDVFGYMESCKYRYNVNSADIWNGFLPDMEDIGFLTKVKEGLQERELVLANLCVDGAHFWEDDPAEREQNYKNALAAVKAGEFLGAQTIRVDAGGRAETWTNEQFDLIVKRYKEFAQRAKDNGYRFGPENHWGTEEKADNMKKLAEAVDNPGFGVLLHFRGNTGDAVMAPWAMHTHFSWDICESLLPESVGMLAKVNFPGYFSVEHHSGKNEYTETGVQLARLVDQVGRL